MTSATRTARWISPLLLGLALTAAPAVDLAASANAGTTKRCGDLRTGGVTHVKRVTAKNITCRRAKQEIYDHFLPGMDLNGYRCRGYPRQTCTKGRIVVAFTYPNP